MQQEIRPRKPTKRKTKKQKELDSGKKKLVAYTSTEILLKQYQNGRKIVESKTIESKEYSKIMIAYEDSLISSQKKYLRGKIVEEINWNYLASKKLQKKEVQRFNSNGKLRSKSIVSYNEEAQPIKEELYIRAKVYKTTNRLFDNHGNIIEETLSTTNSPNIEKTMYIYKYY